MPTMPKVNLREFLLHHAQSRELCVITIGGWINATVFVDHEDLFTRYLDKELAARTVKSHKWDYLHIVDAAGNPVVAAAHFIEVGD